MLIFALRSALMSELEELDDNRTLDELCEPAYASLHSAGTIELALDRAKEDLEGGYHDTIDPEGDVPKLRWHYNPLDQETSHYNLLDDGDLVGRIVIRKTEVV